MNRSKRYSPEIRKPAVRLVFEHQREYEAEWAVTYNSREFLFIGLILVNPPIAHLFIP